MDGNVFLILPPEPMDGESAQEQVRELRAYVQSMTDELSRLLLNLQTENFTEDAFEHIEKTGDNPSDYARTACRWAKNTGLIVGDGNGNYGWNRPITRQQAAVLAYKLFDLLGGTP